jgi:hypothetical protein
MLRLNRVSVLFFSLLSLICMQAGAETIYSTNFSSGLDANWTVSSSNPDIGVIFVGPRGSHAHVLNMDVKGKSSPVSVINSATLSLSVSPHRDFKLSFDHFATEDNADPEDRVKISTDGIVWQTVWQSPLAFTDGMLQVADLDLSAAQNMLARTGLLLIRFQSLNAFQPGHLRTDGRGWSNISVASVPVPEPSSMALLVTGMISAGGLLQRRRTSRRK